MTQAYTRKFTEVVEPVDTEFPDSLGPGTITVGPIDMSNHQRAVLLALVGDMAATSTLDIALHQSTDAAMTTNKAIAGKAATQLTKAGGDGDQLVAIEVRSEELDVNGGYRYVYAELVIAAAAVEAAALLLGYASNSVPVAVTAYDEVVD